MSFRIVVLDGYTLSPLPAGAPAGDGHPSWGGFEKLGQLTVYERTGPEEVVERASGANALLVNKVNLSQQVLDQLPELGYVGILATGTNVVDLEAARARGITVTNVPGYSTDSVAQHTFALLLALVHRIREHDRCVRDLSWSRQSDFSLTVAPMKELAGKTLGIVGLGAIGQRVAQIGQAMGMRIAALQRPGRPVRQVPGVEVDPVEMETLFERADVLSLHCPLNEQTRGLVNAERLARMKRSAYLLNTSRGPLVDEQALAEALRNGRIAGAGLDVLSAEPPPAEHPLIGLENCIITAHIAWSTVEARARLMQIAVENLEAFIEGRAQHVVN